MKLPLLAVVAVLPIVAGGPVRADNAAPEEDAPATSWQGAEDAINKALDGSVKRDHAAAGERVAIVLDQERLIAKIPSLQHYAVLNPQQPVTYFSDRPYAFSTMMCEFAAEQALIGLYVSRGASAAPNPDKVNVRCGVTVPGNGSQSQALEVLSFSFDRQLASHTDWGAIEPYGLPKIAKNFRYGQEVAKRARAELNGG